MNQIVWENFKKRLDLILIVSDPKFGDTRSQMFRKSILKYFEGIDLSKEKKYTIKDIEEDEKKEIVSKKNTLFDKLEDEKFYTYFKSFLQSIRATELILFYEEILKFKKITNNDDLVEDFRFIVNTFIKKDSDLELNVTENKIKKILSVDETNLTNDVFDDVFLDVKVMLNDQYYNFQSTKLFESITYYEEIQYFEIN
jgi:hypothetical protein